MDLVFIGQKMIKNRAYTANGLGSFLLSSYGYL